MVGARLTVGIAPPAPPNSATFPRAQPPPLRLPYLELPQTAPINRGLRALPPGSQCGTPQPDHLQQQLLAPRRPHLPPAAASAPRFSTAAWAILIRESSLILRSTEFRVGKSCMLK